MHHDYLELHKNNTEKKKKKMALQIANSNDAGINLEICNILLRVAAVCEYI